MRNRWESAFWFSIPINENLATATSSSRLPGRFSELGEPGSLLRCRFAGDLGLAPHRLRCRGGGKAETVNPVRASPGEAEERAEDGSPVLDASIHAVDLERDELAQALCAHRVVGRIIEDFDRTFLAAAAADFQARQEYSPPALALRQVRDAGAEWHLRRPPALHAELPIQRNLRTSDSRHLTASFRAFFAR